MDSRYDIKELEERIYKLWEKSGFFNPDNLKLPKGAKSFSMMMPPTNANGSLHAGHGLVMTIQDIITRYKRMRGFKTLWLPGMDHAGFETQVVYEKQLEKEGRSRFQMDPKILYEEILKFTLNNKQNIKEQIEKMGASCDWSREKFTLDPEIVKVVEQTFKKLYDNGLVYRGKKIVNWCAKHQTSLSDLETSDVEQVDELYYLKYGPFVIATARPETKFGDKYVVMHPDDKRYSKYTHGEKLELEWINGKISATVIKDKAIDMKFGTGAMTITPWHDQVDFEMAERHKLDREQIIDLNGKLLPIAGEFAGLKIKEARPKIIEKLQTKGLVDKIETDYSHVVKTCYKCNTLIEPQIKEQWFIKMKPLAKPAIAAIKSGKVKYLPEHYKKISLHWMQNILDWNISRQITWGIRIPAWFCLGCTTPKINAPIKEKWFLVRHGETDWNKEKKYMGRTDVPLNETGINQAKETAKKLKGEKIDLIITSNLKRAEQTARIIAEELGIKTVVIDESLKERDGGDEWEGKTLDRSLYTHPSYVPEGGEGWKEVEERVWSAFKNHRINHKGKNVLVVSHGGVMRILRLMIKKLNQEEGLQLPHFQNTEILPMEISTPCKNCGGDLYEQDTDVFDTWFSSGQWPFATLLANTKTGKDFKLYYPNDIMETAGDLIFFWVARMIMFGLYVTGKVPFKTVYLHGLVLDAKGQKMSKSRGNVINPLEITDKYGTDAFRIGLVIGNTPGTSLALSEDRIRGYRNFATKIWNVSRFVMMNKPTNINKLKYTFTKQDKKDLAELKKIKVVITRHLDKFEFHLAAEKIYHYFWHTFADKIIEAAKPRLSEEDEKEKLATYLKLETMLLESLKMLHPFMPFITEEVWQKFNPKTLLMVEKW